jgi:tryptophan synthase alpha chain
MDLIFLLAPTSTDERMAQVARVASGYVYYVSLKGVTGAGTLDTGAVEAMLPRIRQPCEQVPVGVGFGIRDGHRQAPSAGGRCRRHRQQDHPADRTPAAARPGGMTAESFLRGIRAALDA